MNNKKYFLIVKLFKLLIIIYMISKTNSYNSLNTLKYTKNSKVNTSLFLNKIDVTSSNQISKIELKPLGINSKLFYKL